MHRKMTSKENFRRLFKTLICMFGIAAIGAPAARAQLDEFYTVDSQSIMEVHPAFQEAMQEYQQEIQQMQQQLQQADEAQRQMMGQMMQQQLQRRGAELQEEAFDKMRQDIQRIADEKGYSPVFDINVVLVGGRDITDEIMDEMDIEEPGAEMPQQPPQEMPEEMPVMP